MGAGSRVKVQQSHFFWANSKFCSNNTFSKPLHCHSPHTLDQLSYTHTVTHHTHPHIVTPHTCQVHTHLLHLLILARTAIALSGLFFVYRKNGLSGRNTMSTAALRQGKVHSITYTLHGVSVIRPGHVTWQNIRTGHVT